MDAALTATACALAAVQVALMWLYRPERHREPIYFRVEASPQKLAQYRTLLAKKAHREAELARGRRDDDE